MLKMNLFKKRRSEVLIKKIGVLICSSRNHFFNEVERGITEKISEICQEDFDVIVEKRSGESVFLQKEAVHSMMKRGINALIITPISDPSLIQYLKTISEKIPVMTLNRELDGFNKICHVGTDYKGAGRAAARLFALYSGGVGNIAIFTEDVKMASLNNRIQGFSSLIEHEYPDIRVIDIIQTTSEKTRAYDIVCEYLKANNNKISGIFIATEQSQSIIKAIEACEFKNTVICFGINNEDMSYLKSGVVKAVVLQNPYEQGRTAAKIISEYLVDKVIPKKEKIIIGNQILINEILNQEELL